MTEYKIKEIKEQIDVIKMSQAEYDSLNNVFREGLKERMGVGRTGSRDLDRIILTNGYQRVELHIEVG